jgi:hypothetical protein
VNVGVEDELLYTKLKTLQRTRWSSWRDQVRSEDLRRSEKTSSEPSQPSAPISPRTSTPGGIHKEEQKNLKRKLLTACPGGGEAHQSVPLVIGQFLEMVDAPPAGSWGRQQVRGGCMVSPIQQVRGVAWSRTLLGTLGAVGHIPPREVASTFRALIGRDVRPMHAPGSTTSRCLSTLVSCKPLGQRGAPPALQRAGGHPP